MEMVVVILSVVCLLEMLLLAALCSVLPYVFWHSVKQDRRVTEMDTNLSHLFESIGLNDKNSLPNGRPTLYGRQARM